MSIYYSHMAEIIHPLGDGVGGGVGVGGTLVYKWFYHESLGCSLVYVATYHRILTDQCDTCMCAYS